MIEELDPGAGAAAPLEVAVPSTRGNSLLTDICMWFLRGGESWLPTAVFVSLYGSLGVAEPTARTALHRMTKGGLMVRERRVATSGYAMSDVWRAYMDAQDQGPDSAAPATECEADEWVILTSSVPETRRADRHALRVLLSRGGMAPLGNGVWIAPGPAGGGIRRLLEASSLHAFVDVFMGRYAGFGDARTLAGRLWNIDAIERDYEDFMTEVRNRLAATDVTDEEAFIDLVLTSNAWRKLASKDPLLPAAALPETWPRAEALRLRNRVHSARQQQAARHVEHLRAAKPASRTRDRLVPASDR